MNSRSVICTAISLLCASAMEAQVIDFDGEKLDCDTAYTTLELGWCSRHLLDSARARMDGLVILFDSALVADLEQIELDLEQKADTSMLEYLNEERQRLTALRGELHASQEAFNVYAEHSRNVVGEMMGMGRERTIHENMTEYGLVNDRIAVLEGWIRF